LVSAVALKDRFSYVLSKATLLRLKLKTVKSGAWFRVLKSTQRALVDTTIVVVDRVRSSVLTKMLLLTVVKLVSALRNRVEIAIIEMGLPNVSRVGMLAQKWGNKSAWHWRFDLSFARFVAIIRTYSPSLSSSWCEKPVGAA
jgi:hypothetical protein